MTLLFASGNHDPRRFENQEEFDMHRTDNRVEVAFTGNADHMAFGCGRHVCLGMQLSRREVDVALSRFLDGTRDVRLADGFKPEWTGNIARALPSLKLTYEPV